jgi:hypothetical protein
MKNKEKHHTVGTFPKSNRKIPERGQIFVYNMIRFYGDVVHKEKQRKFNDFLYKDFSFRIDPLTNMAAIGNSYFWLVNF